MVNLKILKVITKQLHWVLTKKL